jgi:tripartite-type tricarboxylate transporter receptor subunit TctC
VNPALYRKIAFDPVKDFEPIVLMVATPNVLIVNPAVPVKSVTELVATAKADPKRYNYGSTGIGSSVHLQMEQFKSNVGIQMTHIPYKGSSQALTDLLAGSTQVMFDNFLFQLPHIRAGKVKPLAITAKQRSALLPDVPTLREVGIQGFDIGPWFGLAAPAKTPAAIVNKVNADVNDVLRMKDVQDKLQGAEIVGGTPQQFAEFIGQELEKWGRLIRALDLKAE